PAPVEKFSRAVGASGPRQSRNGVNVLRLPKLLDASSWGCHSRIIAPSAIQNPSRSIAGSTEFLHDFRTIASGSTDGSRIPRLAEFARIKTNSFGLITPKAGWSIRLSQSKVVWWTRPGSNRRPPHCERCALPAELTDFVLP